VKCDQARPLVAAYADGELEGFRRRSVDKHLRACARCAAQHADILALRTRLRADVPYFAAPPGLQQRVRAIGTQDRLRDRRDGAFALRPCHMDDWISIMRVPKCFHQREHAVKVEIRLG